MCRKRESENKAASLLPGLDVFAAGKGRHNIASDRFFRRRSKMELVEDMPQGDFVADGQWVKARTQQSDRRRLDLGSTLLGLTAAAAMAFRIVVGRPSLPPSPAVPTVSGGIYDENEIAYSSRPQETIAPQLGSVHETHPVREQRCYRASSIRDATTLLGCDASTTTTTSFTPRIRPRTVPGQRQQRSGPHNSVTNENRSFGGSNAGKKVRALGKNGHQSAMA
jgi:hypothetical protein